MLEHTPSIDINGRCIGTDDFPYIIAELSANHNGSIETAFELIERAKLAGADAIKLQTYTADTLTLNSSRDDFKINTGLWAGKTLYQLYDSAHTPWDWHPALFAKAKEIGITLFSSPFDTTAIDFLEDLNAPAYKIASFEVIDLPLIRYAASTGKPLIISTGMANLEEIEEAVAAAKEAGCVQLALLHCVSGYPASPKDYNLKTLVHMAEHFDLVTGLSDHTLDNTTAIASVAMGAAIIEKHFTLDRLGGGPDDSFSLEPDDLNALCQDSKTAWSALGSVNYDRKKSEQENIIFRRSLYFVKDANCGELLTDKHIKSIRPGYGLAPKYIDDVIGKKAKRNVKRGMPVSRDDIVE
ncbi:MAG: pseudaminic acid synthase [Cellvibrionaceae bacterium]